MKGYDRTLKLSWPVDDHGEDPLKLNSYGQTHSKGMEGPNSSAWQMSLKVVDRLVIIQCIGRRVLASN